jgi:hypothetical protein
MDERIDAEVTRAELERRRTAARAAMRAGNRRPAHNSL